MEELPRAALEFGGSNRYSGVSTSRTLMLKELTTLLDAVPADAARDAYGMAVVSDNVLLKPSLGTRRKTYAYLRDRFALDPDVPVFRVLRMLWDRDAPGRPLLALLVAAFRDPVLRSTVPTIVDLLPDQIVTSPEFARAINATFPGKLGPKTLESTGENMTSSYRQSGHLSTRRRASIRQRVTATPGSAALALLLATLEGRGGQALLDSAWVRLLDSPPEQLLAQARLASSHGWLEYRQAGGVLEITFHQLLDAIGAST